MRVLTWDCDRQGCYHEKMCPKLGVFDECLPPKMGMSDVDGIVEINGRFLLVEWKSFQGDIPAGQRIMFQRLTEIDKAITVLVVVGDPQLMTVQGYRKIWGGEVFPAVLTDLDGLKVKIKAWAGLAYASRFK